MTSITSRIPEAVKRELAEKLETRGAEARTGMLSQHYGDGAWLDRFFDDELATPHVLTGDRSISVDGTPMLYFLSLNPGETRDLQTAEQHMVGCVLRNPVVKRFRGWERRMRIVTEEPGKSMDLVWCAQLQSWRIEKSMLRIELIPARDMPAM